MSEPIDFKAAKEFIELRGFVDRWNASEDFRDGVMVGRSGNAPIPHDEEQAETRNSPPPAATRCRCLPLPEPQCPIHGVPAATRCEAIGCGCTYAHGPGIACNKCGHYQSKREPIIAPDTPAAPSEAWAEEKAREWMRDLCGGTAPAWFVKEVGTALQEARREGIKRAADLLHCDHWQNDPNATASEANYSDGWRNGWLDAEKAIRALLEEAK